MFYQQSKDPKMFSFILMYDEEKLQIITFKTLQAADVC